MQGQTFGKLTTIVQVGKNKNGTTLWRCQCSCGKQSTVPWTRLTSGTTRSCGCLRGHHLRTHGQTKLPEYTVWAAMLARCRNPKATNYRFYGGRGIRVCDRWHHFPHFLADVGRKPDTSMTLDRIDGNGNYEPGNVRWASRLQQAQNVRHNVNITARGKTQSISVWSRETGINPITLRKRVRMGLTGEAVFQEQSTASERAQRLARRITHRGETKTLEEWANYAGVRRDTLRYRLKKGWSMDKAIASPTRTAPTYTCGKRTGTASQWAAWTGMSSAGIRHRLSQGWCMEDVVRPIVYNRYSTPSRRKAKK